MIPGSANPLLLADAGYQIQRSLRFRSSASGYLARTPAVAGNRTTWTWSGWVKRGALGEGYLLTTGSPTNNITMLYFGSDDKLNFWTYYDGTGTATQVITGAQYRDPSAWYHVVAVTDTSQATSTNRIRLYVNGALQAVTGTYPAQNQALLINATSLHLFGRHSTASIYLDGYLSEVNFVDGQALTPSSFGEISPTTGQWQAKKYSGTYGTNGFYLPFTDSSAATATAIGADKSGNGNNWTPNNISLTAGVTYDSMLDTPLGAGGAERGNYCTFSPLSTIYSANLSNGNLNFANNTTGQYPSVGGTIGVSSGKWYYEAIPTFSSTPAFTFGFTSNTSQFAYAYQTLAGAVGYSSDGTIGIGSTSVATVSTYGVNDVIGIALNLDAGTAQFYKNGVVQAYTVTGLSGLYVPAFNVAYYPSQGIAANFGQRPFAYTPPTGFKALHTGNLPDPVIKLPAQYMAATTYLGNGATQSISNAVNGVGFQPDLVWTKARSSTQWHGLYNSIVGIGKYLVSNSTNAEATYADTLTAFNAGGFSLGNDSSGSGVNTSGTSYVGWQWKANGAAVANNAGSIASQVSAGVAQGFSVVTYTGTGAAATVGHGLGVAPKMVIVKNRIAGNGNWVTYHASIGPTGGVFLNLTNAAQFQSNLFNNTAPTSSVFSVSTVENNTSGNGIVAYCFSEVAGYSKFGSYVGNGSADGPFVYCGFRPRYVMVKMSSSTGDWRILDTTRNTFNAANSALFPNLSDAEASTTLIDIDITSNGFKLRNSLSTLNASGGTYIFMAFAEAPQKFSLAR